MQETVHITGKRASLAIENNYNSLYFLKLHECSFESTFLFCTDIYLVLDKPPLFNYYYKRRIYGEMAELVEGARLEIVYTL